MDGERGNRKSSAVSPSSVDTANRANRSDKEATPTSGRPRLEDVATRPKTAPKPTRFCLLEDSYSNLRVIMRACHDRGFQVDHYASANDALEALRRDVYDALIVSDSMTGGAEACQTTITRVRGRADKHFAAIPILAVASHADANRCRVLETLGATSALSDLSDARLAAGLATLIDAATQPAAEALVRNPTVLLLEDSYNLSLVLTHALAQMGHSVNHVATMELATAALSQRDFAIVLLSQNDKPDQISTIQFIEQVRTTRGERTALPQIWVLTENLTSANVNALHAAGAEHILDKRDPLRLGNALFALSAGKSESKSSDLKEAETPKRPELNEPRPKRTPSATAKKPPNALLNLAMRFRSRAFPALGFVALTFVVAGGVWLGWTTLLARTPVDAVTAQRGTVELTAAATGLVVSKRQVDLTPTQTGQLYRVYINEGDLVRKGEALATLDNREATVNVRRAEAQMFRFKTELSLANKALQASRDASETSIPAQTESDAENERAVIGSKLRVAEQELNAARVTLDRLRITAPYSGAITRSWAIEGKWVEAGTPLFTLADLSAREVALHIPANMEQNVATGLPVRLFVESNGENWKETVARVVNERMPSNNKGARTQTTVFVTLGDDAALPLGQRVLAQIVTEVAANAVVVPFDAVIDRNGNKFVAVVNEGRAVIRPVDLGIQNRRDVEIRAGLQAGEVVVTSHVHLDDGQRVAIGGSEAAVTAQGLDRGFAAQ